MDEGEFLNTNCESQKKKKSPQSAAVHEFLKEMGGLQEV